MRSPPAANSRAGPERPISKLALGCSQIGSLGHSASGSEWRRLIELALETGVSVFDTADIYGQGDSERQIGRLLAGRRDAAFVVTKIGKRFSPAMGAIRPFKPLLKPLLGLKAARTAVRARREGTMRSDFTPSYLARAMDASLRRLGFDQVDAVLLHGPAAEVYRDPAVAEVLAGFVREGKALRIGASCEGQEDLAAALTMPGLGVLQLSLKLFNEVQASGLADAMVDRGLMIQLREILRAGPARSPAQAVQSAARLKGVSSVIVGTSNPEHLRELAIACA